MDELCNAVAPYTKSSPERLLAMIRALETIQHIPGDIVECGVWRGGNIALARVIRPERRCWLFDTFKGMTKPEAIDKKRNGASALAKYKAKNGQSWQAASVSDVVASLRALGVYDVDRLQFIEGDVCETLYRGVLPERIALLRLDTDWHASTKAELEILYPRLVCGGVLIVDDYGYWLGARKAVDDYFAGQNIEFDKIDDTAIMMIKR